MKHVNFGTAKKLKAVGYEQPPPASGQTWYYEMAFYIAAIESGKHQYPGAYGFFEYKDEQPFMSFIEFGTQWDFFTHAPDATEILQRIQMEYSTHSVKLEYRAPWGKYAATFDNPNSELNWTFYDTNPHEVMARLYIQIKESVNTENEE